MRSPTQALLWEIWSRHRTTVAVIGVLTIVGRLVDLAERTGGGNAQSSPVVTLLSAVSFLLLFNIFSYIDSGGSRGFATFPQRLFILPVSSLRLVSIPVLAGIIAIELLYLLWLEPLTRGGATARWFVAVLLGSLMVFYQVSLWTLARARALRVVFIGAVAVAVFGIGLLPTFPPSPVPLWRSEPALAAFTASLAIVAFVVGLWHVARLRRGADAGHDSTRLAGRVVALLPRRRTPFASPAAAHFWFEWRTAGLVLPLLVAGVLLGVVAPISWVARDDGGDTWRLLMATLAAPVVLAVPVGMAFAKPGFSSEDTSVPSFVAVRPLSSDDLVAIRVKVAAASAAASWLLVLVFLAVWLPTWADLDVARGVAHQFSALHRDSVAGVFGSAVLYGTAATVLTWRSLVCRLWIGLSGRQPLLITSLIPIVVVMVAATAFDTTEWLRWLFAEPAHTAAALWTVSAAVVAKWWLAAYAWRRVTARYGVQYLAAWAAGTMAFVMIAVLLSGVIRAAAAVDLPHLHPLLILLAVLAVPIGRVGLAPSALARNRHR